MSWPAILAVCVALAAAGAARAAVPDWWKRDAMCVRAHEGAWTSNTGNGYYGGFQMDLTFQRRYGPGYLRRYGTADRWSPALQLAVAYRGWRTQGWGAWPNSARECGLR